MSGPLDMPAPAPLMSRFVLVLGLVSSLTMASGAAKAESADLVASGAGQQAVQIALETRTSGTVYAWQSRDGSLSGKVVPRRTFRTTTGTYCREFAETVTDGVDSMTRVGLACRDETGQWIVAEE